MKVKTNLFKLAGLTLLTIAIVWGLVAQMSHAHCDTLDGPVVIASIAALDKGDVTPVLKWISKKDEDEIRKAFEKTIAVRKLSPQAKELADMYFFETLVRVHRASEGESYTGLKPVGTAVESAISAADKALETGSVDNLIKEMTNTISAGIQQRFNHAIEARKHAEGSVENGRQYVKAYVEFVHYVEGLHKAASGQAHTGETPQGAELGATNTH
ncbi:MAG: hypothetical protein A2167_00155 [Planctomycetes bacterium RBG_13_46_10]|nr:MAG: hypothetical protein A2167_00155 [Planctomycetes bacterium RBG_13_46_10]